MRDMRDLPEWTRGDGRTAGLSSPRIVGTGGGLGVNETATPAADIHTWILAVANGHRALGNRNPLAHPAFIRAGNRIRRGKNHGTVTGPPETLARRVGASSRHDQGKGLI
ncbi:hypothetical protein TPA0910_27340 [Streptomyces hygroscopicus subsp. sporocinereus]|uniref:Uncharacterized protein n=1 Tax=Streptomyces hygroscopicus TaxID=1912 RepID=A0ABQ3TY40_STRHY|nr:hypothetical protein TPA0910_27340 [Streptomyces hygroscopicus]GLV75319.1 hypothetical protein Shyhy02_33190 [Streptomyces hygroscopicus subsp. hygroscopicus]